MKVTLRHSDAVFHNFGSVRFFYFFAFLNINCNTHCNFIVKDIHMPWCTANVKFWAS